MKDIIQNKNPFFDMNNANDLYDKLAYEYNRLKSNDLNAYDLLNFIFTANHLEEWIRKDKKFNLEKKNKAEEILNKDKNINYSIIKSICNRSKHFYRNECEEIKGKSEFSFAHIDFNDFSFGSYYYVYIDNRKVDIQIICDAIYNDYKLIME